MGCDFPLSANIPEIEPAASFSVEADVEEDSFTLSTGTVNMDELELVQILPAVEARKTAPLVASTSKQPKTQTHRRKKITADDVLQAQHEALICKKETLSDDKRYYC